MGRKNRMHSPDDGLSYYSPLPFLMLLILFTINHPSNAFSFSASSSAKGLLDQEMYQAQARRAEVERELMEQQSPTELLETKIKPSKRKSATSSSGGGGGGGFGAASNTKKTQQWSKQAALAQGQAKILEQDGVIRINQALSPETCRALREHVLAEVENTANLALTCPDTFVNEDYYGIEPTRKSRTDLLLSLLPNPVTQAFVELFHAKTGKLRSLYEELVTPEGILYELACVTTSPGSIRQTLHPDLPYQDPAPLYVVFLALQDVTNAMGPTTFLKGTNTAEATKAFEYVDPTTGDKTALDELIGSSEILQATIQAGDVVVFDARTMHCGTANMADMDNSSDDKDSRSSLERAMFNFSFRNPQVTGSLGYKGSMRPEYTRQEIRLKDVLEIVDNNKKGGGDEGFAKFGNGLPQR